MRFRFCWYWHAWMTTMINFAPLCWNWCSTFTQCCCKCRVAWLWDMKVWFCVIRGLLVIRNYEFHAVSGWSLLKMLLTMNFTLSLWRYFRLIASCMVLIVYEMESSVRSLGLLMVIKAFLTATYSLQNGTVMESRTDSWACTGCFLLLSLRPSFCRLVLIFGHQMCKIKLVGSGHVPEKYLFIML